MSDLELELQAALSRLSRVLGIDLGSSERAVYPLTSEPFLQAPHSLTFFGFIRMPLEVEIYTVASSRSVI